MSSSRPMFDSARSRLGHQESGYHAPPVADAVLTLASAVLAVAEAINKAHAES